MQHHFWFRQKRNVRNRHGRFHLVFSKSVFVLAKFIQIQHTCHRSLPACGELFFGLDLQLGAAAATTTILFCFCFAWFFDLRAHSFALMYRRVVGGAFRI